MRRSLTGLEWFRRDRALGVAFFVLLVLLVGVERRLADAHHNLRSAAPSWEGTGLDGDELRIRLIVLNDDKPPSLAERRRSPLFQRVHAHTSSAASFALGRPAPRGPPLVSGA